jgi:uncharacterized protein
VRQDDKALTRILLEAGANPDVDVAPLDSTGDKRGSTPLILAASTGDVAFLDLLIAHKADVNRPKDDGLTALICAIDNGEFETVRRLIAAGASIQRVKGIDPVELARQTGRSDIAEFLSSA